MKLKKHCIILLLLITQLSFAQRELKGIGQWEYHIPYNKSISIADAGNIVYSASELGILSYDKESGEIGLFNKSAGLSDVNISIINYYQPQDILMIAYKNGNIDILQNNTITNFNAILRKQIVGEKSINHISFYDDLAFISTTFGVVVFDLIKLEFKETYSSLGSEGEPLNVYQALVLNDSLFLASEKGLLAADFSPTNNLLDFNNWSNIYERENGFRSIAALNNNIWLLQADTNVIDARLSNIWNEMTQYHGTEFMNSSNDNLFFFESKNITKLDLELNETTLDINSNYPTQIISDGSSYWVSDLSNGLIKFDGTNTERLSPVGVDNTSIFNLSFSEGKLFSTKGGYNSSTGKLNRSFVVDYLSFDSWTTVGYWRDTTLLKVTDVVNAISDGVNNYYATNSEGIVVQNGDQFTVYNSKNSPLKYINDFTEGYTRANAIAKDSENKVWVGNHGILQGEPSIYKINSLNDWQAFKFPTISGSNYPLKIFIDENDIKWVTLGSSTSGQGVLVFDDINEQQRLLTSGFENGDLQDNKVNDIAFDKEGAVWMVGRAGVSVFQSPETIFEGGENNDASKPIYEGRPLMENEYCTSIVVDGGNRKWIGTENGLFLLDENGTEVIENFNMDNSPLPTNKINDLEMHPETGELFIGTDLGLLTYRTNSSLGLPSCKGLIKVFPNPVTPDFNGEVGISVLSDDAEIKITDTWGNLVYSTQAYGGTGSWDLKDYNGNKAESGVYTVLVNARGRKASCSENLAIIK